MSVKSNPNPPGSDNPAKQAGIAANLTSQDGKKKDTHSGLAFNDQMYLLDRLANNPRDAYFGGRNETSPQVISQNIHLVNSLTANFDGVWEFLHQLTPHEYAQLVPEVQMMLVHPNGTQTDIPLIQGTNIRKSVDSAKYYTGNVGGLKSLKMSIDGNTNPVSGKIYKMDLVMVFDSLNTFLGKIPGSIPGTTLAMTYADIFRAYGYSKGTRLKFSIGYTSENTSLIGRYNLHNQHFVGYLTFIKSDLSIDENMKTEVKASFQSWGEGLLASEQVFDFLNLDLAAAKQKAKSAAAAAQDAAESKGQAAQKLADRRVADLKKRLRKQLSADILNKIQVQENNVNGEWTLGEVAKTVGLNLLTLGSYGAAQIAAAAGSTAATKNRPGIMDLDAKDRQRIIDIHVQKHLDHFEKHGTTLDSGNDGAGGIWSGDRMESSEVGEESRQLFSAINQAKRSAEDTRINAEKEQQAVADKAASTLNSVRRNAINEALNSMLFGPSKRGLWRSININAEQVQKYLNSVIEQDEGEANKYLTIRPEPGDTGGKVTPNTTPPPKKDTHGPPKQTDEEVQALKEVQKIKDQMAKKTLNLNRLRSARNDIATQSVDEKGNVTWLPKGGEKGHIFTIDTPEQDMWFDEFEDGPPLKEQLQKAEGGFEELEKKLKAAQEKTQTLQQTIAGTTAGDLLKQLSTHKKIEFITLGDLLCAAMNRVNSLATVGNKSELAQKEVRNTLMFLTKMDILTPFLSRRETADMYKIPISKFQLQKYLSDQLFGKQKDILTVFELFKGVIKMITLAQQKKTKLSAHGALSNNYTVQFIPYEMEKGGGNWVISTKIKSSAQVRTGLVFYARGTERDFSELGGNSSRNRGDKIPEFVMGGVATGALKKIGITEQESETFKKAIFERNQSSLVGKDGRSPNVLPTLFSVTLTLAGTAFFQMGTTFYLSTPTLAIEGDSSSWFFLEGYYQIVKLSHSFTAKGQYETVLEGKLQTPGQQAKTSTGAIETLTAAQQADSSSLHAKRAKGRAADNKLAAMATTTKGLPVAAPVVLPDSATLRGINKELAASPQKTVKTSSTKPTNKTTGTA